MSKITSKNLSYDSTLPPFLQRLQANNNSLDGRNEFQSARPKKARNAEDDAEDEPVYFDEERGETLSKQEWEEREKAEEEERQEGDGGGKDGKAGLEGEKKKGEGEKERIVEIGGVGSRKRKAGKVVGAVEGQEGEVDGVAKKGKTEGKIEGKKIEKGKAAKKGKKIKLSFGYDE